MSTNSLITSKCLNRWTKNLKVAGISTARLDALVLIENVTGKDRAWLLAHPDYALSNGQVSELDKLITRRIKHEPLAYIRGKSEFYGRTFIVNPHTLEPRPETETMIELLLDIVPSDAMIVDVGTGSGCIAITAKLELPSSTVLATDIDQLCVDTTIKNATTFGADIITFQGDLLRPVEQKEIDTVAANLPYVPNKYQLNKAAEYEPRQAIFGGDDGLDLYRRLFDQINQRVQKPSAVLTESLPFQHDNLRRVAQGAGYSQKRTQDFIQLFTKD